MLGPKKGKTFSKDEAYAKILAFCAYQERSVQEVVNKLYGYGLDKDTTEKLIKRLKEEKYLNEERFALTFAGGKFRIKHWGKNKISQTLKAKGIEEKIIKNALKEIEAQDYYTSMKKLLARKEKELTEKHPLKRKYKLAAYLIRKGYEPDMVWKALGGEEEE